MKQTQEQLHNELMHKLSEFTDDLGYHLPPDKIPDTTKSLINLFITYEKYRDSILFNGKRTLEKGIGMLPIEKQKEFDEPSMFIDAFATNRSTYELYCILSSSIVVFDTEDFDSPHRVEDDNSASGLFIRL